MTIVIARRLNLKGLASPMPIARTAQALAELHPGDLLEVLATDPGAVRDFAVWTRSTGNDLLESSQLGHVFRFVVRKR